MTQKWIEVWVDSGGAEYVLVVRRAADGQIEICDPQERWKVIERFADYETAMYWLSEDEYDLVEGRYECEQP